MQTVRHGKLIPFRAVAATTLAEITPMHTAT